jgi:hypothetical protein
MALALFSALNFLSKLHRHLTKPEAFVTDRDRNEVSKALSIILEALPQLKEVLKNDKTRWSPQPNGSCNEEAAFSALIKALLHDGIDIGLQVNEAGTVWKQFRNKLAHMAQPEGWVEVYGSDRALTNPRATIENMPSFRKADGHWVCNADRLSVDVQRVADWLCERVDACCEHARVTTALTWLQPS